jgi:hypothetical protein
MSYAQEYTAFSGHFDQKPPRLRTKARIRFIGFVRPDGYWPYPYTIEQAFHVFHWMVVTGEKYRKYGWPGVYDLLSKQPTCLGISEVYPITSIDDLRSRFHYALLSRSRNCFVHNWRADNGISVTAEKILTFPHYEPFHPTSAHESEKAVHEALSSLLAGSRGKVLGVSLNPCHPKATWVGGVTVHIDRNGFSFIMDYGYVEDLGWCHTLAATEAKEPFTDVLHRAEVTLAALIEGKK